MFNEHVIDYIDMIRLGDVRCEADEHVLAYQQRQEQNTQIWDAANEVWWQL